MFLAKEGMLRKVVFIGYLEDAKYPPDKYYISCSRHKILWKLAYLSVKMTSLDQKHKIIINFANFGVSKLHISFQDIKLSGKLPILV